MYKCTKRIGDFFAALLLMVLCFPLLVLSTIIIYVTMGFPIIFKQKRIGYRNREFYVYKFRTMTNRRDSQEQLLPDMDRMTWSGSLMRKFSIDELPQLFNVLNGTMSFIGPRPLLVSYLPLYNAEQLRRHHVIPGISGWAQVNGRNRISWKEKFEYDVYYVDNQNFFLDVKIMVLTVYSTLFCRHINSSGEQTMVRFNGSN